MKVINLDSKFELSKAQISFVESVIICGEDESHISQDSISFLMNEIPIFLISSKNMPNIDNGVEERETPATDWLGFYQNSSTILGINIPVIGLCPERIISQVKNDEELLILIAKVIIHEFAHAKMTLHPGATYSPIDEFYQWMEEPMANLITLKYFENYERCNRHKKTELTHKTNLINSLDFVKDFIFKQPNNYRLGLDLFKHRVYRYGIWCIRKNEIQKNTVEKQDWLDYVKVNVGNTDETILKTLFKELYK